MRISLALLVLLLAAPVAAQDVTVFIGTAGTHDGFVEPASANVATAIEDLRLAMASHAGLVIVDDVEGAAVRLLVLNRRFYVYRGVRLDARLESGDYRLDLNSGYVGKMGKSNTVSASRVADKVAAWITENRARLMK